MRALFSILGLAIAGCAVVAFCYAIYAMGHIGTCASGGPYVSARPCPAGTGMTIALIPIAIVGGLIGIGVYSAGVRWKRPSSITLALLMWSFTFLGAAGALAYAAWGPAAYDVDGSGGVKMAAIVLLVIFIPMGIIPLLTVGVWGDSRRSKRVPSTLMGTAPSAMPGAPVAPRPTISPASLRTGLAMSGGSPADVVVRLERLASLRQSGAITQQEFDRLKATLLGGG